MSKDLENLEQAIYFICTRPGMYTGNLTLNSLQIYIQGLFHGMDICGSCSFDDWRQWVYTHYLPNKNSSWMDVLVNEFDTEENVIEKIPELISLFVKDYNKSSE